MHIKQRHTWWRLRIKVHADKRTPVSDRCLIFACQQANYLPACLGWTGKCLRVHSELKISRLPGAIYASARLNNFTASCANSHPYLWHVNVTAHADRWADKFALTIDKLLIWWKERRASRVDLPANSAMAAWWMNTLTDKLWKPFRV